MFRRQHCGFDHTCDRRSNIVLKLKNIRELGIEAIRPEMGTCRRIKQLRANADPISSLADRAFQHIQDPKLSADLFHVYCSPLEREARIAGDHKEPADTRQSGDDLLDHAIDKVPLLRVATQVLER